MSKKKNKSHRQELYDLNGFDDFDDDREIYFDDVLAEDEDWFDDEAPRFDIEQWRNDLTERGRKRERMRRRDLRRGVLPDNSFVPDFAFSIEEEEEEEEE